MLDVGWSELLVIGALALVVVGPKDLPLLMRQVGRWVGKARSVAHDFRRSMEDAAREADIADVTEARSMLNDIKSATEIGNPASWAKTIAKPAVDPAATVSSAADDPILATTSVPAETAEPEHAPEASPTPTPTQPPRDA